jgi:hypothetical protein
MTVTACPVGEMGPVDEDDELALDMRRSFSEPEELRLEEDEPLVREGEDVEDVEAEEEEEASLAAAASWHIFAREGLIRLPDIAKKMEESLEARLR